jgi:hypothetical protein
LPLSLLREIEKSCESFLECQLETAGASVPLFGYCDFRGAVPADWSIHFVPGYEEHQVSVLLDGSTFSQVT